MPPMPRNPNNNGQTPFQTGTSGAPAIDRYGLDEDSLFLEFGASGLKRTGGIIFSDDNFLPSMSYYQSIMVYSEMKNNDWVTGSTLFSIDNLARQVPWTVHPYSNKPADLDAAQFLEECMHDLHVSWTDLISEALTMCPFGWAFCETVFKRRRGSNPLDPDDIRNSKYNDGKVGWAKISLRAQETLMRWEFGDGTDNNPLKKPYPKGQILGMWQLAPPEYKLEFIPKSKCVLFRTTAQKDDPQGRSILRNAYRSYFYKKRLEEVEAVGIERDLAGLPMAGVDPRIMSPYATADEKAMLDSIKFIVKNVRRDSLEGIVYPIHYNEQGKPLYTFELLTSGGTRQIDVSGTISRKAQEQAATTLTDFMMLGHEGMGSYALSNDKTTMFGNAIGTILDIGAQSINMQAVPRLFHINGMDTTRLPTIHHGEINDADLVSLAAMITAMSTSGVIGTVDPVFLNWLRDQMGAPHIDPYMSLAPPLAPPSGPNGNSPRQTSLNASQTGSPLPRQPAANPPQYAGVSNNSQKMPNQAAARA